MTLPTGPETSLRLSSGLHRYWWVRGNLGEGYQWLSRGLVAEASTPGLALLRARALYTLAWIAGPLGHVDEAEAWAKDSVALFRQAGQAGLAWWKRWAITPRPWPRVGISRLPSPSFRKGRPSPVRWAAPAAGAWQCCCGGSRCTPFTSFVG